MLHGVGPHTPLQNGGFAAHTLLQPPQLKGSLATFTHFPAQQESPWGQLVGPVQLVPPPLPPAPPLPPEHFQIPAAVQLQVTPGAPPAEDAQPMPGVQHGVPLGPQALGSHPPVPPAPPLVVHCHRRSPMHEQLTFPPGVAKPQPVPTSQQAAPVGPQPAGSHAPPEPPRAPPPPLTLPLPPAPPKTPPPEPPETPPPETPPLPAAPPVPFESFAVEPPQPRANARTPAAHHRLRMTSERTPESGSGKFGVSWLRSSSAKRRGSRSRARPLSRAAEAAALPSSLPASACSWP